MNSFSCSQNLLQKYAQINDSFISILLYYIYYGSKMGDEHY